MTTAGWQLIVNADDLGRTPGINSGIFAAHENGVVTSATLMVGFDAAGEAAELSTRYPQLGIGLHVTLTGSSPVLPADRLPSLVDERGRFPDRPDGLKEAAAVEVQAEVEAQFERFRELTGRLPTHLDSHHHAHRLPVVCDALVRVALEWELPVRNASAEVRDRLRQAAIPTTDLFIEKFFGADASLMSLVHILEELPPGVTELMCHPARVDDRLRRDSSYVDARACELDVLIHPTVRRTVREQNIRLTHFGELSARGSGKL